MEEQLQSIAQYGTMSASDKDGWVRVGELEGALRLFFCGGWSGCPSKALLKSLGF
jgi:hypothetical protein